MLERVRFFWSNVSHSVTKHLSFRRTDSSDNHGLMSVCFKEEMFSKVILWLIEKFTFNFIHLSTVAVMPELFLFAVLFYSTMYFCWLCEQVFVFLSFVVLCIWQYWWAVKVFFCADKDETWRKLLPIHTDPFVSHFENSLNVDLRPRSIPISTYPLTANESLHYLFSSS